MQNYERSRGHNIRVQSATDGSGEGDVTFIGAGQTVTAGYCYIFVDNGEGDGAWAAADGNADGKYEGLLAIALGSNSSSGMLLRGAITVRDSISTIGAPIYLSSEAGRVTTTRPSVSGTVVRVLGYALDGTVDTIYFNPDNTYILLS